jgi:hypothetical protein
MLICPFEGHILDASTEYCNVVGVRRVADIERDFGIPNNVLVFLALFEGIDEDEVAVVVNPCLSDVR